MGEQDFDEYCYSDDLFDKLGVYAGLPDCFKEAVS
jgi:hypothetical protein